MVTTPRREAEERFDRVHVAHEVPDDIDVAPLPDEDPVHLPAALRAAFGLSGSEARRLIGQGGVKVDGRTLTDGELDLPVGELDGAVVQVGRRRFVRFQKDAG